MASGHRCRTAWSSGGTPSCAAKFGFIASVADADGVERELVTNPVQFDEVAATLRRAPQFSEHGEEILRELGRTDDEIIQLKLDGVVT